MSNVSLPPAPPKSVVDSSAVLPSEVSVIVRVSAFVTTADATELLLMDVSAVELSPLISQLSLSQAK